MIVLDCTNAKVSSGEAIHPNGLIGLVACVRRNLLLGKTNIKYLPRASSPANPEKL